MTIGLTHEYVFNYYSNENYFMKSIYKNNKTKDNVTCPVGHDIEIRFNNFKNMGQRCLKCSNLLKLLSHEEVFEYYASEQYTMNSIFNGCMNKDKLICPVGHNIEIRFNGFKSGNRCRKCSGLEKHSQEFVFNYYGKENYTLNSIYKNSRTKDFLTCPVGHNIEITFNGFKSGNRCFKCFGSNKYSQEFVDNYIKSFGWTNDSIYINNWTKMKLKCPSNHIVQMSFDNFKNSEHRCQKCFYKNNTGSNNCQYKKDRTRQKRSEYLKFDRRKISILNNDPNYNNYIQSQKEARLTDQYWDKTIYSIDHIFPRIAFIDNNLDVIYGDIFIKEICNLRENLRIITKEDNGSKGGKYNQEEFMKWFNLNKIILN